MVIMRALGDGVESWRKLPPGGAEMTANSEWRALHVTRAARCTVRRILACNRRLARDGCIPSARCFPVLGAAADDE